MDVNSCRRHVIIYCETNGTFMHRNHLSKIGIIIVPLSTAFLSPVIVLSRSAPPFDDLSFTVEVILTA